MLYRAGFTLIETLVVIAIIAILAAILFPLFMTAKENARTSQCISNVKQLLGALAAYASDSNGRFPGPPGKFTAYKVAVLPYVKNEGVFHCPNDKSDPPRPVSYAFNPRFGAQPMDAPVCQPYTGNAWDGCGRSVRTGDHSYLHYVILEFTPQQYSESANKVRNHRDGRPFGYLDYSVRWRKNDPSKVEDLHGCPF